MSVEVDGESFEVEHLRAGARRRRVLLVFVLSALGFVDFIVLNLVVWPRCVEERATETRIRRVVDAERRPVAADRGPAVADARSPQADVAAVPNPQNLDAGRAPAEVEKIQGGPNGDATPTESSTIAPPECGELLFASKSTVLSKRVAEMLDEVAEHMLVDREVRVLIRGHADDRGNEPANQKLSERRATTAARFLRKQGISLNRIDLEGVGERMPADRSGTPTAHARNRRIEVIWRGGTP